MPLMKFLLEVLKIHALVFARRRIRDHAWISEDLLNSTEKRDYPKKLASRTKADENWANFKQPMIYVINLKNHLKKQYYQNLL